MYYACLSTGTKKEKGKMLGKLEACADEMQSPEIPLQNVGKRTPHKSPRISQNSERTRKRAGLYPSSI